VFLPCLDASRLLKVKADDVSATEALQAANAASAHGAYPMTKNFMAA